MRSIEGIIQQNSPSAIVMREAIKNGDYDAIDLLSCGSGHDVTDDQLAYYLEHKSFDGLLFAIEYYYGCGKRYLKK